MPDTTPILSNPKNRRERREQQRTAAPRRNNSPRPRRKAEEMLAALPAPWVGEVVELGDVTARKRLAILVLRGEYGFKFLLFVRINAIRTTQTEQGTVEAVEAFDILPQDLVSAAAEANLLDGGVLERLAEELGDTQLRQQQHQRPQQRPLVQRPLQAPLARLREEARAQDARRQRDAALTVERHQEQAVAPAAPIVAPAAAAPAAPQGAWWWAAAVAAS